MKYCEKCGGAMSDDALFCSHCGRKVKEQNPEQNQGTESESAGVEKRLFANKIIFNKVKMFIILIAVFLVIALVIAIVTVLSGESVVGDWMDGSRKISFSEDGEFRDSTNGNYGTYIVDDARRLSITYGYYSYNSGTRNYIWSEKAMADNYSDIDYWYISDGVLYFQGDEFTKD